MAQAKLTLTTKELMQGMQITVRLSRRFTIAHHQPAAP